jgi:peroxiredoxin
VGVVAIGTGGKRYAQAFIEDEAVPFSVLLDEEGAAAQIAGTKKAGAKTVLHPGQWAAGARSMLGGHRQRKPGKRPMQLGATLVIGPGDVVHYADFEDYAGDHADIDAVIAAARAADG